MSAPVKPRSPLAAAVATACYRPAYQSGAICPGCGGRAWHVGRHAAECARCATALVIAPVNGGRAAGDEW